MFIMQKGGEAKHVSEAGLQIIFAIPDHWRWYAYNELTSQLHIRLEVKWTL